MPLILHRAASRVLQIYRQNSLIVKQVATILAARGRIAAAACEYSRDCRLRASLGIPKYAPERAPSLVGSGLVTWFIGLLLVYTKTEF